MHLKPLLLSASSRGCPGTPIGEPPQASPMGVLKQPRGLSLISTAGLEPAKLSQLILNQPCLPISPRRCYLSNEPLTSLRRTRSMVPWYPHRRSLGGFLRLIVAQIEDFSWGVSSESWVLDSKYPND